MNSARLGAVAVMALCVAGIALAPAALAAPGSAAAVDAPAVPAEAVFARVGGTTITRAEYEAAVAAAARSKFYHGAIPESEAAKLRREVGARVVDEVLLLGEAKRRKITANGPAVQQTLDALDARYRASAEWQKQRAGRLAALKLKLEQEDELKQLEAAVRNVPQPKAGEVEAYYAAHPDKFTEPEQLSVSLILLVVDPSSPKAKWDAARDEAVAIVARLKAGADFGQLANLHSGDPSSGKGGDLGYVHRGILPETAQAALDGLSPGQLAEPVIMLEGVAVLRLDKRKPARLSPLDAVADRARELLRRERSDEAWSGLIAQLRRETPPTVDESLYAPVLTAGARSAK